MTSALIVMPKLAAPTEPMAMMELPAGRRFEDIEESDNIFYIQTGVGIYVHKKGLFTRSILPVDIGPDYLSDIKGEEKGWAKLTGKRFPGWLVSQALDFFIRIYDKYKTEAEVCITYNWAQDIFKIFVPEQYVSGASVNYKLNPSHIKRGWSLVGTIHSHCDFSAFHSGTDSHDAEHSNGLHMTIGNIKSDVEYAQMMNMGKQKIDLTLEEAVDWSQMDGQTKAPGWWDRHVNVSGSAPWTKAATYVKGTTFQTPKKFRSVYDQYDQKVGYARRYLASETWHYQNGTVLDTPTVLPREYTFWWEWMLANGIDPRTYLFNKENFPDYFKNQTNTEHTFTSPELITIVEALGTKYNTFDKRPTKKQTDNVTDINSKKKPGKEWEDINKEDRKETDWEMWAKTDTIYGIEIEMLRLIDRAERLGYTYELEITAAPGNADLWSNN